jgi:hypothetical protein
VTVSSVQNFALRAALALSAVAFAGCPSANSPDASRPDAAEKWLRRAQQDYQTCDVDEARDSIQKALAIVPGDPEVKLVAGKIALARLDYDEVLRQLKEVRTSEAAGLRGRALWYKGELESAADELEAMLNDPDVKDDWAKAIAKLARRGAGRTPFALSGGMLAAVEMPHVNPSVPFFVVPLEIDGEAGLALLSTGNAEVVLDSATRPEPSWVSLRFGERFEVRDVPALAQDLSGISKELGAPIRALLGVNVLRHMNVTLDYFGRQFVVRSFAAPPPPAATRVDLCYARGGGMVLRSGFDGEKGPKAALLVDTAMEFPIALDQGGWKKAGARSRRRRSSRRGSSACCASARSTCPRCRACSARRSRAWRSCCSSTSTAWWARGCSRSSASRSATAGASCGSRTTRRSCACCSSSRRPPRRRRPRRP